MLTRSVTAAGTMACQVNRKSDANDNELAVLEDAEQKDDHHQRDVRSAGEGIHGREDAEAGHPITDQLVLPGLEELAETPEEHGELREKRGEAIGAGVAQRATVSLTLVEVSHRSCHDAALQGSLIDCKKGDGGDYDECPDCLSIFNDEAPGHEDQWEKHVVLPHGEVRIVDPEWSGSITQYGAIPHRDVEIYSECQPDGVEARFWKSLAVEKGSEDDRDDEKGQQVAAQWEIEEVFAEGLVGEQRDRVVEGDKRTSGQSDETHDPGDPVRHDRNVMSYACSHKVRYRDFLAGPSSVMKFQRVHTLLRPIIKL